MLWLRQAQPPIIPLHGAWACRRHILTSNLGAWACRRPFLFLPVISTPLNHRIIYYYTRCLSLSKAHSHFSSRCLSLSKAHYFYFIKIVALYRTSPMFLWELKNGIISQNLRELCDIKTNTKNPHTVASTSSATNSSITRCLSLSKAASKKPHNFITSSSRKIPHTQWLRQAQPPTLFSKHFLH